MAVKRYTSKCIRCGKMGARLKFCSRRCSTKYRYETNDPTIGWKYQKSMEENPIWKGDQVDYRALHSWVVRNWGRASMCEFCRIEGAKVYDWSNKTGVVSRDRSNWQQLCRSCHMKYDYANGMRGKYASKNV